MATLTFSYETGSVTIARIVNAMALEYGYQATIDGVPNPQTKAEFGRLQIRRIIEEALLNQERKAARDAAEAAITRVVLT